MVERSTVESAVIEWSLVRFRVSGLFLVAQLFVLLFAVLSLVEQNFTVDTLAEWLRRRPAKPVGSAREGSNPSGVDFTRGSFCDPSPPRNDENTGRPPP